MMTTPGRVFYDTHFAPLISIRGYVSEIACNLVRPGREPLAALINAVMVRDQAGEPASIRFTIFDATERRRYEADLLAARTRVERYRTIVENSADAIISIDRDGLIETWNAGAVRMFGLDASEAIGRPAQDAIALNDQPGLFTDARSELSMGRSVHHMDVLRDGSNEPGYVSISLTPHIEPPGELTGVSAIIRDVTERKAAEDAKHRQELLQNLVNAQEAERQRFARDLHDHLGQQLTGLRLTLNALAAAAKNDRAVTKYVQSLEQQALAIDRDVTFLAFDLRPAVLAEVGLTKALENLIAEWSRNTGMPAELHSRGMSGTISNELEVNFYRIVQESLNNILKHARASNVGVICEQDSDEMRLIIEDNGVGFDPDATFNAAIDRPLSGHGHGLVGIRERAALLGGTLHVESAAGHGTTIHVRVPLEAVRAAE